MHHILRRAILAMLWLLVLGATAYAQARNPLMPEPRVRPQLISSGPKPLLDVPVDQSLLPRSDLSQRNLEGMSLSPD